MHATPSSTLTTVDALVHGGLDDRGLRRAARDGRLTRIVPGTYVDTESWTALTPQDRHRVSAVVQLTRSGSDLVASHETAAVLHGMPLLTEPPDLVHVVDRGRRKSKRGPRLVRHAVPLHDDEVTVVDGVLVTSPARTAVDLCLARGLHAGVVALDHGLRHGSMSKEEAAGLLARRGRPPVRRTARVAISIADAASASALESVSAVTAHLLGAPAPERQKTFRTPTGRFVGTVDFWWPDQGAVGEADGQAKYLDPDLRGGRTAGQVVVDEKRREDELRGLDEVRTFGRWGWAVALDRSRFAGVLTGLGIPLAHVPPLVGPDTPRRLGNLA